MSVAMESVAPYRPEEEKKRPLGLIEGGVIVALAVTHFLFADGPIWRHPWSPNASILWSYAPLPAMVAIALLRGRRLRFGAWAMGTFAVMVAKFVITAFILVGLWAVTSPPNEPTVVPPTAPTMTPQITTNSGEIVVVPQGAIAPKYSGDAFDLPLGPNAPHELKLPIGAPLRVTSGDGHLHTLVAPALGLNVPIVSGATRSIVFAQAIDGGVDLACGVHPAEAHTRVTLVP